MTIGCSWFSAGTRRLGKRVREKYFSDTFRHPSRWFRENALHAPSNTARKTATRSTTTQNNLSNALIPPENSTKHRRPFVPRPQPAHPRNPYAANHLQPITHQPAHTPRYPQRNSLAPPETSQHGPATVYQLHSECLGLLPS